MRVISESKTLFGMMIENSSLYSSVKIDDLSIDNYNLLKNMLNRLERKEKYLLMKLSVVKRISDDLVKKVALGIEKVNSKENSIKNDISIFESKLAILVITKRITDINVLGYTKEFINSIVDKKMNEYNNRFSEYFYNEKTGCTSEVNDGYYLILPYEPSEVKKARMKFENPSLLVKRKW